MNEQNNVYFRLHPILCLPIPRKLKIPVRMDQIVCTLIPAYQFRISAKMD
ncbi:hypothetical protein RchiOBHm_Chr7g0208751 [Rosa chinensis]|uniref:Uncharacterized protein n=1 Tax=Rosa chinensis TaxID=74649 RepID=A0A2P6P9U6_ROSCH|nr:hypothetical protein RchiOBHm_Chr7g0208751 [Rosa chinensis]